jgi:nitrate/TMAO reductase-like tetraheme cytochrome c subunit
MGTLRPKEKFAAVRVEMARCAAKMKETDSRKSGIAILPRPWIARRRMPRRQKHDPERMLSRGETCIDCHKAVGHDLPPGFEE